MTKNNTVEVKRHSVLYRLLHWAIVLEVLLLLLSGFGVSEYLHLSLFTRSAGRSLHLVLGFAWMGTITFFLYYFIVSGEYKWFGVSRIGYSIDFFMHEVKTFVAGEKVHSPVKYDAQKKRYVEKIVPTEVVAWWGWFVLWIMMVLTGLALVFPSTFDIVNRFCHAIVPSLGAQAAATRLVHIFVSVFMVIFAIIHAYASWIFGMVGSMFSGVKRENTGLPEEQQ
ncbi:cytochrome b/b6 domain-containing protein [Seleniivibrio sp.]|uniref:cytochrome b/b6 domain-containing protein n=1 Tax=Seleniivibrio sp. TaxID=2898801 RepID=UPI0025DF574E|nr:cytochrome b/b6 domain-containing protein [Seleniivibrio sp.]MCD8553466.1 cytochrome b/b6 domain-containing protein [Seleniivibrio sp.]